MHWIIFGVGLLFVFAISGGKKAQPLVPSVIKALPPVRRYHVRFVNTSGDQEFRQTDSLDDAGSDYLALLSTLRARGEAGTTVYIFDQQDGKTIKTETVQ